MIGICNVVFGAPFIELWDSICLPTELSPSNRDALNRRGKAKYILYTNAESVPAIEKVIARHRLNDYFSVELQVMTLDATESPYQALTASHQHCIANYKGMVDGIVFSSADLCFHQSYFKSVYDTAISKNKSCITFSVRISLSCLNEVVDDLGKTSEFDYTTAVRYLHHFLHPIHQNQTIHHNAIRSTYPSTLFEQSGDVLSMRGFHMHPIYITSEQLNNAFTDTIDGEFVESLGHAEDSYVLMSGVNAPFVLSLTADSRYSDLLSKRNLGPKYILKWAQKKANCVHKDFFSKHVLVTSLSGQVNPDHMDDYSPQLTALKRMIERSANPAATNSAGSKRYRQLGAYEIRLMAISCWLSYLLNKINLARWLRTRKHEPAAATFQKVNSIS